MRATRFGWTITGGITIADVPVQIHQLGDAVDLQVVASATGGGPLTYIAAGLPNGLSINPSTGAITGTIAKSSDGAGVLTTWVTVRNSSCSAITIIQWDITAPELGRGTKFSNLLFEFTPDYYFVQAPPTLAQQQAHIATDIAKLKLLAGYSIPAAADNFNKRAAAAKAILVQLNKTLFSRTETWDEKGQAIQRVIQPYNTAELNVNEAGDGIHGLANDILSDIGTMALQAWETMPIATVINVFDVAATDVFSVVKTYRNMLTDYQDLVTLLDKAEGKAKALKLPSAADLNDPILNTLMDGGEVQRGFGTCGPGVRGLSIRSGILELD